MNSVGQKFLRAFTISILQTMNSNTFSHGKVNVINADLVPYVSEHIVKQKMLIERKTGPVVNLVAVGAVMPIKPAAQPIAAVRSIPAQPVLVHQTNLLVKNPQRQMTMPAPKNFQITEEYGKIDPLLNDTTVSSIECSGAGQNLSIIRAGQKQFTKISLNPQEIKDILDKIANKARVPLMEGVFKAAVDNFTITAVVSSVIGSRFIIKKATPYSRLE